MHGLHTEFSIVIIVVFLSVERMSFDRLVNPVA